MERFVGKRTANALAKLELHTVRDLLLHVPFRLAPRGELMPIEAVHDGEAVTVVAKVLSAAIRPMHARRGFILTVVVTDGEHDLELAFFAKNSRPLKFHEMQLEVGTVATFSGTISSYRGKLQLTHPEYSLIGDFNAVDRDVLARPIPIYHSAAGVPSWKIGQALAVVMPHVSEADVPDPLPAELREAHHLPAKLEALKELHQPSDLSQWQKARERMAYEEAFVLQTVLAQRTAHAKKEPARACPQRVDGVAAAFDRQLPFTLTNGQLQVGKQIAHDIASSVPMRRLLQGDVGTGKTIVALRAMLQVIDAGGQAVLLAPTEVLARQHLETFAHMLGELGHGGEIGAPEQAIRLELLTGSLSGAARRAALARIAAGEAQLIVGTHALLYDSVQLPFLGLVVVDEQHRFGVNQRDALARGTHLLVMTATPIPRTIAMTLFGDLDVSTLSELPKGRAEVRTVLVPEWNEAWLARVWQRAREEVERGGRVYVVCPRISARADEESEIAVEDTAHAVGGAASILGAASKREQREQAAQGMQLEIATGRSDQEALIAQEAVMLAPFEPLSPGRELASVEAMLEQLRSEPALQGVAIGSAHGQLSADVKAAAMADFSSGKAPVLVATTVIEVGIDVPQATMMVIMDADRFGLSQLHQLRGRVGRGSVPSLCLAVYGAATGTVAYERLKAFAGTRDGFALAEKDLELRAEGDVLGAEQAGKRSSLRFLSVIRDADIIETAKAAAHRTIAQDPELSDHIELAAAVAAVEHTASAAYIRRT
ncbi:MAG: ATP-dependent DNA helicase RecG [Arcanobacterium sp.]|nr:ATP-dependent DNA helicase RecG [Arcanobacterium sp.]